MRFLDDLNDEQRVAVLAGDEPVLIVAGPGTGKTRTLTARIAYLLETERLAPNEIVALTFTAKAARELRERLAGLLAGRTPLPAVKTFHALSFDLVKAAGCTPLLITETQRSEIIRSMQRPAAFQGLSVRELSLIISRAKTTPEPPDDAPLRRLLHEYQTVLAERQLHDFDDLLHEAYDYLQGGSPPLPYKHVLVDEFQDTNELQYELLKLLTSARNLFAIGDPNQSIYAFRGAGAEMFDRFRLDFSEVKRVNLTVNYRARPELVRLANAVFPKAPQLVAARREPGSAQALQTLNEYSEAAYVIAEIEAGIGGSDFLHAHAHRSEGSGLSTNAVKEVLQDMSAVGMKPGNKWPDSPPDAYEHEPRDYAVLYRTHRAGQALQKAFAEAGVPYQVAGEGSPYARPAMQAVIAGLRFLQAPIEANLPVVQDLKPTQLRTLLSEVAIADGTLVTDAATAVAERLSAISEPNLPQFLNMLVQFGAGAAGLAAAVRHLDQISENDFYDPTVNAVTLLTIHASKGLEFPHVFLCAAEETVLPKLNKKGEGDLAEERRLFYVAVTRAKDRLVVLHAKTRGGAPARPSRFIIELAPEILPQALDPNMAALEKRAIKRAQKRAQTSLF